MRAHEDALHHLFSACRGVTPEERDSMMQASLLAVRVNKGTIHRSGGPFVEHPLAVAQMHLDAEVVIAAVLHDVVEDAGYPLTALRIPFGAPVASLVDAVTVMGAEHLPRFLVHNRAACKLMRAGDRSACGLAQTGRSPAQHAHTGSFTP